MSKVKMFLCISACKHKYGLKASDLAKSIQYYKFSKRRLRWVHQSLKWKKLSSGANFNNFRCEQKICGLLWTMYALFCFDGFVRAMLEDVEAFCTRPQNELGFWFLKFWVNIMECAYSWNNFYSTNGLSFIHQKFKAKFFTWWMFLLICG